MTFVSDTWALQVTFPGKCILYPETNIQMVVLLPHLTNGASLSISQATRIPLLEVTFKKLVTTEDDFDPFYIVLVLTYICQKLYNSLDQYHYILTIEEISK